jgi:hypothetical protein
VNEARYVQSARMAVGTAECVGEEKRMGIHMLPLKEKGVP